jgi:hypothetical protein
MAGHGETGKRENETEEYNQVSDAWSERGGGGDKKGQKKRTPGSLSNSKYAPCTSELSEVYFTRLAVTEDYKVARGRMTSDKTVRHSDETNGDPWREHH